jgi:hypothetical protein
MRKLHIHVSSVHGYFALPKKEREFCGLYKMPVSLTWAIYDNNNGWDAFFKQIAKKYPLQHFFRVQLFSYINSFYMFIKHNIFFGR